MWSKVKEEVGTVRSIELSCDFCLSGVEMSFSAFCHRSLVSGCSYVWTVLLKLQSTDSNCVWDGGLSKEETWRLSLVCF